MRFVEAKALHWERVRALLAASEEENQWANFGPVSRRLEREIERMLSVPPTRAVVVASSGTAALFALCGVLSARAGHPLRWLGSAFAFGSTRNGPLADTIRMVDCDDSGLIDLAAVECVPTDQWDGLLVTNTFGQCADGAPFTDYCRARGKAIVVDNAQCLLGFDRSTEKAAEEIVSLHHTKPWGTGEGGFAIVTRADEKLFRNLLNFGYRAPTWLAPYAANGKMSDIAAAAILARLETWPKVAPLYRSQRDRLVAIAVEAGYQTFARPAPGAVIGFVPLVAPAPVSVATVKASDVPLAKYYPPLADLPNARRLFDRMVGIACHPGMAAINDATVRRALLAAIGG
jgi:dTDP-4-amino-4,6-dideoxygalactose transaminase